MLRRSCCFIRAGNLIFFKHLPFFAPVSAHHYFKPKFWSNFSLDNWTKNQFLKIQNLKIWQQSVLYKPYFRPYKLHTHECELPPPPHAILCLVCWSCFKISQILQQALHFSILGIWVSVCGTGLTLSWASRGRGLNFEGLDLNFKGSI